MSDLTKEQQLTNNLIKINKEFQSLDEILNNSKNTLKEAIKNVNGNQSKRDAALKEQEKALEERRIYLTEQHNLNKKH